ncbi:MAG: multiheme c-type cytochrome [Chloroflexota bacterium]
MKKAKMNRRHATWLTFAIVFAACLAVGAAFSLARPAPAVAAPPAQPAGQEGAYAGSEACSKCHEDLHTDWTSTRHAQAFSSPIFQRDWHELKDQTECLECHTTGYNAQDGTYAEEGVTCESCHGPFQPNHPKEQMPIEPDADLCARCHKATTDEWKASPHAQKNIQCQSCHNPHSQAPMADSITALCTNCHKQMNDTFAHGTHASAGLECSNCHMYTAPREGDPIHGLTATGHTFLVGSDACIGCHQDTVHSRNELVKLGGNALPTPDVSVEKLQKTVQDQEQTISNLETSSQTRLYTGLFQGAIVGLLTGGAAAWVVSRRIREVEVEDND